MLPDPEAGITFAQFPFIAKQKIYLLVKVDIVFTAQKLYSNK